MANDPTGPEFKTFVMAEGNGEHPPKPPPQGPKRLPEVNEAILERATAKLEALSEHIDKSVTDLATKKEVQLVYREVRATRKLLEAHLDGSKADTQALNLRLEGMMSLLGQILSRLPEPSAE